MPSISLTLPSFTLIFATLLAALAPAVASSPYYHSAECVARGENCTSYFSERTGSSCDAAKAAREQPERCVTSACKWCGFDSTKYNAAPCTSPTLRELCGRAAHANRPSEGNPNYFSARCVAMEEMCTPYFAVRATACAPGVAEQTPDCVNSACIWCGYTNMKDTPLCQSAPIKNRCMKDGVPVKPVTTAPPSADETTTAVTKTTAETRTTVESSTMAQPDGPRSPTEEVMEPTVTPSPSPAAPADAGGRGAERDAGDCTWKGEDGVVINLGEVKAANGWERTTRDGFTGLVYRPQWGQGLSPPELGGAMCFPVRVSEAGDYFWTFVSYAPHVTEHNDAWVKSENHPMRLWKILGNRTIDEPAGKYLKAYQGNGVEGGMSVEMKTVDSDGHRFTVLGVKKDETFRLCLSGRSFKFSVFRLVLNKCFGTICEGGSLWREYVYKMPVSRCE